MTESNPFQTPESDVTPGRIKNQIGGKNITCQTVPVMNGAMWVIDGFRNFLASPFTWMLVVFLYFAMLVTLSMMPFVSIISSIIAPIFMAGLMICARENNDNQTFQIKHLFDGFTLNGGKLAGLGALNLGIVILVFMVVGIVAVVIVLGSIGNLENIETMTAPDFLTQENGLLILLVFLIALALMLPVTMAFWFSPALIIFHDIDIFESLKLSFMGCIKNMIPYLIYSLFYLFIYLIASIPLLVLFLMLDESDPNFLIMALMFLIGTIEVFVMSVVLLASIYTSYNDIFFAED